MTHEIAGLADIADSFDGVLVDQFGVLHDGQKPFPGANVTDVIRMFGREMKMTFEVTESEPPDVISIHMTSGPIRPINRMTFSSQDGGTLLRSETTIPGLMGRLMGRTVISGQKRNFQKLKELLEAGEL